MLQIPPKAIFENDKKILFETASNIFKDLPGLGTEPRML
jgi:hypothetical protein